MGSLYLVPTPIGNLEDITLRALRILQEADFVACEDARRAGLLMKRLNVETRQFVSYHEHNEKIKTPQIIERILAGENGALISDAGSPSISDPGYRLVAAAIESGVDVVPLPGATAAIPALAASGLPCHSFVFAGFPPQKKGRRKFLQKFAESPETVIFYESPHRIAKLVGELVEICGGERNACLARELTKLHEEFIRGDLNSILKIISERTSVKGEIAFLIEGVGK